MFSFSSKNKERLWRCIHSVEKYLWLFKFNLPLTAIPWPLKVVQVLPVSDMGFEFESQTMWQCHFTSGRNRSVAVQVTGSSPGLFYGINMKYSRVQLPYGHGQAPSAVIMDKTLPPVYAGFPFFRYFRVSSRSAQTFMAFVVKCPPINQLQLCRAHSGSHLKGFWAPTDIQTSNTDAVANSEKSCNLCCRIVLFFLALLEIKRKTTHRIIIIKSKNKVRPKRGHETQKRYSSTLSLTSALDGVGG